MRDGLADESGGRTVRRALSTACRYRAFTFGLISRISRPCSNATICSKHSEK
jgi:hypothetical protein